MGAIQESIELNDEFSNVIYGIINAVNLAVSSMEDMQQAMNAEVDTSGIAGVRNEINSATMAMDELNAAMQDGRVINPVVEPVLPDPLVENPEPIQTPIQPNAPPDPVEIPVEWHTDGLDVFTGTGIERFQQEVQSANNMLNTLNSTQTQIQQTASTMDVLPDAAVADINAMGQRLQAIQQRIQTIENNPVNMGTDRANRELELLRSQLNTATQQQNSLNLAMQNMDVGGANEAYLNLSQTIGNTERYIRDNTDEQGQFNQSIQTGTQQANDLMGAIKGAVAAYLSIQTIGKALDISDELTQTNARLNMMNQAFNEVNGTAASTDDLVELVYGAAQNARGSFSDMASVVARFGNNARDAFSSQKEVIAFASLVQKQMTIAGASTAEASNAILQLSQGLGSGTLRGDELNSISEQAPNLIQNIADYLEVPIGSIREMASEGELTADIVKAAIFSATDEINANFESMPATWGQVWQGIKNTALISFQPVLQRLNELANSDSFQQFVDNACDSMAVLADAVLDVFNTISSIGSFIYDNWSTLEPIILGVASAFAIYTGYMAAYNTVQAISNGLAAISAARSAIKAGATLAEAAATTTATGAQVGLNAAIWACPVTWIIAAIIALIVCFVIFTEQIVGAIWWLGALFKNIGLWIANCGIAAWEVIKNIGLWFANLGLSIWTVIKNIGLWFANLGHAIWAVIQNVGYWFANLGLGIWAVIKAAASNIGTAFGNAWIGIQVGFWSMVDIIMQGLKDIAEFANDVLGWMGVDIDTSGLDFAAKKVEELNNSYGEFQDIGDAWDEASHTFEYEDVGDAMSTYDYGSVADAWNTNDLDWSKVGEGFDTFDTFEDGWGSDAYAAGAEVGADIKDWIGDNLSLDSLFGTDSANDTTATDPAAELYDNVGSIAESTSSINSELSTTTENLKYLRDVAEREAINRFTTAEIKIEQTNHNTIASAMDLDGVTNGLTDGLNEAIDVATEGVHI